MHYFMNPCILKYMHSWCVVDYHWWGENKKKEKEAAAINKKKKRPIHIINLY